MAAGLYDITNETLGKGHFAVVKLAKHCLTGEHVAIKIIDKAKLNKEGLDQLSSEIRLWSILSEREHPNVVKLYQCIDTRTKLYLVMEYCGGQVCDLYDHIQKKNDGNGLAEDEARSIFRQVCNAILYCHSLKIVHRDLKPENILIISNNQSSSSNNNNNNNNVSESSSSAAAVYPVVKLIDFGFSNQWAESELFRTSCGSLAYSAPEILLGNQYQGSKVDIWALGCILYIILYGCNPFMQFNDNETLIKILDCSFTTPERATVSQSSISLINGLLKKEPEKRLTVEQILKHPWLQESAELNIVDIDSPEAPSATTATAPTTPVATELKNEHVQDHIIDQMIDQGIALPKDTIRRILQNEHSPSSAETSGAAATAAQSGQATKQPETEANHPSRLVNDHHYIKATYQLLKDKSLREGKGVEQNLNLNNYNKRGNILKKANYVGGHNNLKHRLNMAERSNAQKANLRLLKPHFVSLDVPSVTAANSGNNNNGGGSNGGNSFALPLARKCSIVSEEGSMGAEQASSVASSYSEPTVEKLSEQPENTHPPVDIFVTDSSVETTIVPVSSSSASAPSAPSASSSTAAAAIFLSNSPPISSASLIGMPLSITESISEFSLSQSAENNAPPPPLSSTHRSPHITTTKLGAQLSGGGSSNGSYTSTNKEPLSSAAFGSGLHPVSSSPDLLTSTELLQNSDLGDDDQEADPSAAKQHRSTDLSGGSRRTSKEAITQQQHQQQDTTFECLSPSFPKDSLFSRFNRDAFAVKFPKKLNNVRVTTKSPPMDVGKGSSSGSSVRVQCIVQSKSMNNIALVEQQQQQQHLQHLTALEQGTKLATSMSSVSIKPPPPRTEKTDCCTVS